VSAKVAGHLEGFVHLFLDKVRQTRGFSRGGS
jgi:hypothetical protein